jgi:hypothetical protein
MKSEPTLAAQLEGSPSLIPKPAFGPILSQFHTAIILLVLPSTSLLSSHLLLGVSGEHFPRDSPTKIMYVHIPRFPHKLKEYEFAINKQNN